jgi:hypothetical protein
MPGNHTWFKLFGDVSVFLKTYKLAPKIHHYEFFVESRYYNLDLEVKG